MDVKVLRYFLALADKESVTAAAESLHITQPTLSRQLAELEAQLGTLLFIRGNRKITLTEEGKRLRQRAQEIISLVKRTEAEFNSPLNSVSGDLYIGAGETYAMQFIARIIGQLRQQSPHIRIHLYSGNAEAIRERIDKGLLDFGLLIAPTDLSPYESLKLPDTDRWGLLMRKDDPLAIKSYIPPVDLENLPLIVSSQRLMDQNLATWLQEDFKSLNIVGSYNLIFNAALLVEAGIGYALCLDRLINTETEDSVFCFKPLKPDLSVHSYIIWKKNTLFSKPAQCFLNILQSRLK